jgi:bifunctional UDP-N-acetylglucosamine pyrophosphorylase/glucosamine-1-phosphate N-acetyltransferase
MQCVILVAGRGTRMGNLCDRTPKPMLPILGKPKLAYSLENLPSEITEVILIVGYLKEKIITYFGDEYKGKKIRYVIHETIDGTGKVLHSTKDLLEGKFLVIMGDDLYTKEDLSELLRYPLGVLAIERSDAKNFGIIQIDKEGNLDTIIERPHGFDQGLINTGAYVLSKEFFSYPLVKISEYEYGLPQTLVGMKEKFSIKIVRAKDWFAIGDPKALEEAQTRIQDFIEE